MPKHRGHVHLSAHHSAHHGGAHLAGPPPLSRRSWPVTLLAVAVVATVAALALAQFAPQGTTNPPEARPPAASPTATQAPPPSPTPEDELTACRRTFDAVRHVLVAVRPTMGQWQVHIEAMNRLVAGKITLTQAAEFWDQTRVGATRRYDAFAAADQEYLASAPGGCDSTNDSCAEAAQAAQATLDAARTTLRTWHHHIGDMEALSAGTLSPEAAGRRWITSWQAGREEVRTYERLAAHSAHARCG